eukprot:57814_1
MSQQKHDEIPRGPIHNHMHDTVNPITNIDSKLWDCPDIHTFKKIETFFETFNKESQCLLAEGGQSNIYTVLSTDALSGRNKLSIAKCYRLGNKGTTTLSSIWSEFVLVKHTQLLIYDDIYCDESKQCAIIISEPLNYTLRDYVEVQKKGIDISEHECKIIILDIMDKLWTTHRSGFIHNDLTPDNIMYRNGDFRPSLTQDDNGWQIIDYGLMMNQIDAKEDRHRYKGTRGWTSPETVPESNENTYSFANDIWALGLIIIYILCKTQPYTLTAYEQTTLCNKDRYQYRQYFYYNKLLQRPFQRRNKLTTFIRKRFQPHPKEEVAGGYEVDRLQLKAGQLYLKKYLRKLWQNNKISSDLCHLLANYMLHFDPTKRFNCAQIYKNKWFDDVRHL